METKRIFLLAMLQGRVQEFANDLSKKTRENYKLLCTALTDQFGAHKLVDSYRQELFNCQQGKEEKLRDLVSRVRRLVGRAFPEGDFQIKENMAVHHFTNAIRDQSLCIQVKGRVPVTLEDALNIAMREESIQACERPKSMARVHVAETPGVETKLLEQLQGKITELEQELRQKNVPQSNEQGKEGPTCWYCKKIGHCKYDCEKFKKKAPLLFAEYVHKRELLKQGNGKGWMLTQPAHLPNLPDPVNTNNV